MSKPRLLDLFCKAGGASAGYARAGFDVTGVDIEAQPRYPFTFVQGDALEYVRAHGHEFDAIHASPPCQAYSAATPKEHSHADLYGPTRAALIATGLPYAIENVIGAPYASGVMLCGSMFGLTADGEWIQRHRNFETSWFAFQPACAHPKSPRALLVTGHAFIRETRDLKHSRQGPFELAQRLMGIDWMSRKELTQAIPPAYCFFIGQQLMLALQRDDGDRSSDSWPAHIPDTSVCPGRRTGYPRHMDDLGGNASFEHSDQSAYAETVAYSQPCGMGQDVPD